MRHERSLSFRHPSLLACLGCFASLGISMKRWLVVALALIVIAASLLLVRIRLISPGSKAIEIRSHLIRVPNSAYKYHLCAIWHTDEMRAYLDGLRAWRD